VANNRESGMKPPILRDFPESFETERLLIRSPLPGDGQEEYAAVRESFAELAPWMAWPEEHRTVEDSEASVRRARARFVERTDLMLPLFLKGTGTLVGGSGLHRIDWAVPKFEIGYWCRTRFSGKGYVTEAVRGISAFALEAPGRPAPGDPVRLPQPPEREGSRARRLPPRRRAPQQRARTRRPPARTPSVYSMIPEEHEAVKGQNAS
jgi:RimJ/RimL family protein N-acetyltransferase